MSGTRYRGWDVLSQREHWDDATRKVVLDRVYNVPPFRFFNAEQQHTLEALCERVIPQGDRPPESRVPIAPWIDSRCFNQFVDGFRFEDMPEDHVAWVWGLEGLDQASQAEFGARFVELNGARQDDVLKSIREGHPAGSIWQQMPPSRWFGYVAIRQISGVYYAHPFAWNEIGFGGPAYPRGYSALNFGAPETWEPREAGIED